MNSYSKIQFQNHCISEQDFYNFIVNNIGVDMRIVCLINLMKKEKLSESENPL